MKNNKLLITLLLATLFSISVTFAGQIIGTLNHWYSNASGIGYWSSSQNFKLSQLDTYIDMYDSAVLAIDDWNRCSNAPISLSSSDVMYAYENGAWSLQYRDYMHIKGVY